MAEDEVLVVLDAALTVQVDVEQLAAHSACAIPAAKFRPAICSCPNSGFTPDDVGVLELGDERERVPDVGSKMSPRGSFGLGSSANRSP